MSDEKLDQLIEDLELNIELLKAIRGTEGAERKALAYDAALNAQSGGFYDVAVKGLAAAAP